MLRLASTKVPFLRLSNQTSKPDKITTENVSKFVFMRLVQDLLCNFGMKTEHLIVPHGGYQKLRSYQMSEIVYDSTVVFCNKYISKFSRTHDQMVQAARSGKQNIAEGSMVSGTSKKTELKLVGVARGSLEELLQDYGDFLRQNNLPLWPKEHSKAQEVRALCYRSNKSYMTYKSYVEERGPEVAANTLICLINQTNYLLDQQLRALDKQFLNEGGFTERLYEMRQRVRLGRGIE